MNEKNSCSVFCQWDKGFELASGEYVWIAESDDIEMPTLLESCVRELDHNPKAVLAFTEFYYINSASQRIEPQGRELTNGGVGVSYYHGDKFIGQYLLFANCVCNASMAVFRRSALPTNKLYTQFRYTGDKAFWILVAQCGDVVRVHEPLNLFRMYTSHTP